MKGKSKLLWIAKSRAGRIVLSARKERNVYAVTNEQLWRDCVTVTAQLDAQLIFS
jgi:hypothetical protein